VHWRCRLQWRRSHTAHGRGESFSSSYENEADAGDS
jgi:hypothetical protein